MTEKGVPMNVVADYLGHKSLTTTRRYAHRSTELLRGALQKIL
jgi:site-specific recombinase XerD